MYGIKNLNVVLLTGGFGTRDAEYIDLIPKYMVRIGNNLFYGKS